MDFLPERSYTAEEVETIVARRLVVQSQRMEEQSLKERVIQMESLVSQQQAMLRRFEPLFTTVEQMGVLQMNAEEKAALLVIVKRQVMETTQTQQRHEREMDQQRAETSLQRHWTRVFAMIAVIEPVAVHFLDKL